MKTILLAEDDPELRALVRTTLAAPKYRIIEASRGDEALQQTRRQAPDLVLLDWMMPGMSGIDVLSRMHDDPATARIPVLMLTAVTHARERRRGLALGARGYLSKPFSPRELLENVETLLAS